MPTADDASLLLARRLLADARRVLVLTGAGVSHESGVPTFRGPEGLWRNFRPEELATPAAFARDPRLVWEWYGWRRELIARCQPNAAHHALARWALTRDGVRLVTQNVDGLHAAAASLATAELGRPESDFPRSAAPVELHGSVFRSRCTGCGRRAEDHRPVDATSRDTLPHCAVCGALLRPDVVWFGESLDERDLAAAVEAAGQADTCLVVGTSALVQPAASLAAITRRAGGRVVEVNPEGTPLTPLAAVSLRLPAVTAVPVIAESAG